MLCLALRLKRPIATLMILYLWQLFMQRAEIAASGSEVLPLCRRGEKTIMEWLVFLNS